MAGRQARGLRQGTLDFGLRIVGQASLPSPSTEHLLRSIPTFPLGTTTVILSRGCGRYSIPYLSPIVLYRAFLSSPREDAPPRERSNTANTADRSITLHMACHMMRLPLGTRHAPSASLLVAQRYDSHFPRFYDAAPTASPWLASDTSLTLATLSRPAHSLS